MSDDLQRRLRLSLKAVEIAKVLKDLSQVDREEILWEVGRLCGLNVATKVERQGLERVARLPREAKP